MSIKNFIRKKLRCFLGFHSWEVVDRSLPNLHRKYNQCKHCKIYGKLVEFRGTGKTY